MIKDAKSLNPHVEKPFLVKDKTKWYIQFWYKNSENKRKPYKKALTLNSKDYLKKVKGEDVEINKVERKLMAQGFIDGLIEKLGTYYFNPENATFENRDKSSLPFTKYLDDYITDNSKYAKSAGTKKTYLAYNNTIKTYLSQSTYQDEFPLSDVDQYFIQDLLSYIETKNTIAYRDNILMYVRAVFNHCVDYLEIIPSNPTKKFDYINKFESTSNKAMNIKELRTLLDAAKKLDIHFYILLRVAFYTLKRPDAILQLKYENFDFEGSHITFPDKIIKTNKKEHATIPENVMAEIKSIIPKDVKPDDYFLGNIGKVQNTNLAGKAPYNKLTFAPAKTPYHHFGTKFDTVRNQLKLADGHTLYGMKHSGIVYLIEEHGWTNRQIMDYTGHTNESMLNRYARGARRKVTPHPATL